MDRAPGSQAYRMRYSDRPPELRPTGGATGTGLCISDKGGATGIVPWISGLQEELQ
jgi:hypothetical protein